MKSLINLTFQSKLLDIFVNLSIKTYAFPSPKEHQILFYKTLESNGKQRFKPYLEELKKILEISE